MNVKSQGTAIALVGSRCHATNTDQPNPHSHHPMTADQTITKFQGGFMQFWQPMTKLVRTGLATYCLDPEPRPTPDEPPTPEPTEPTGDDS